MRSVFLVPTALRVQELIDAGEGMLRGIEGFETWGGESLGVRISALGIFEMVNNLISNQLAFFALVVKLDHQVGPFTMLLGNVGHFIYKVITEDGTFDGLWPKKIGARIETRHNPTLLALAQVVDAMWVFGRASKGQILVGIFSNFSIRMIEPRLLAST
jgi:hypothetical protein